jgi:4-oxalocrotonate tautomerase
MPVITVQMLSGRTPAQKQSFIKQVAEVAVRTLDVPERAVTIVLMESSPEDWGVGGKTMAEIRSAPPVTPSP